MIRFDVTRSIRKIKSNPLPNFTTLAQTAELIIKRRQSRVLKTEKNSKHKKTQRFFRRTFPGNRFDKNSGIYQNSAEIQNSTDTKPISSIDALKVQHWVTESQKSQNHKHRHRKTNLYSKKPEYRFHTGSLWFNSLTYAFYNNTDNKSKIRFYPDVPTIPENYIKFQSEKLESGELHDKFRFVYKIRDLNNVSTIEELSKLDLLKRNSEVDKLAVYWAEFEKFHLKENTENSEKNITENIVEKNSEENNLEWTPDKIDLALDLGNLEKTLFSTDPKQLISKDRVALDKIDEKISTFFYLESFLRNENRKPNLFLSSTRDGTLMSFLKTRKTPFNFKFPENSVKTNEDLAVISAAINNRCPFVSFDRYRDMIYYFDSFLDKLHPKTDIESANGVMDLKLQFRWFLSLANLVHNTRENFDYEYLKNLPTIYQENEDLSVFPWIELQSSGSCLVSLVLASTEVIPDFENSVCSKAEFNESLKTTLEVTSEKLKKPEYAMNFLKIKGENYYSTVRRKFE